MLDTNYLLYLADPDADKTKKAEVLTDFAHKLEDENSYFALTSLIRYEVLRGVKWKDENKLAQLENVLKQFKSFDITDEIADLARDLYRFDEYASKRDNVPKNLEKRKFDMFHYATAKVENLEVLSKDGDLSHIEELRQRMTSENN